MARAVGGARRRDARHELAQVAPLLVVELGGVAGRAHDEGGAVLDRDEDARIGLRAQEGAERVPERHGPARRHQLLDHGQVGGVLDLVSQGDGGEQPRHQVVEHLLAVGGYGQLRHVGRGDAAQPGREERRGADDPQIGADEWLEIQGGVRRQRRGLVGRQGHQRQLAGAGGAAEGLQDVGEVPLDQHRVAQPPALEVALHVVEHHARRERRRPQRHGLLGAIGRELAHGVADSAIEGEVVPGQRHEALAGLGEVYLAARLLEQRHPQVALEGPDGLAQALLGHVEPPAREGVRPALGDGQEVP